MQSDEIINKSAEAAETLALQLLAYIIADAELCPRFLDLTGLEAAGLRARAGEAALLAAVLGFITAHEPTLLAAAAAIVVKPNAIAAAAQELAA